MILDTMEDLGGPQGSYPEGFVSLSLFLAEIYKLVVFVNKVQKRLAEFFLIGPSLLRLTEVD